MSFEPEISRALWPKDKASMRVKHLDGSLKTLKSHCQADSDFLWTTNLGDLLNSFDSEIYDTFSEAGHAMTGIIGFILNQLKLRKPMTPEMLSSKLNERDSSGITLLHKEVERRQINSVALLLASGADPGIRTTSDANGKGSSTAWDILSRLPDYYYLRELRDLFDLTTFARQRATDYCCVSTSSQQFGRSAWPSVGDLQKLQTSQLFLSGSWTERSTWIHVPSTNGLMVLAIFKAIETDSEAKKIPQLNDDLVYYFYNHFETPNSAPGDPLLNYREKLYRSTNQNGTKRTTIVFPCLALSTLQQQKAGRRNYETLRAALLTNTSGSRSAVCTVHLERTLDAAYYPGLNAEDFEDRNEDQVVSRKFKKAHSLADERIPILMVPQLWLWAVGGIIISAYSMKSNFSYSDGSSEDGGTKWSPTVSTSDQDAQLGLIIASQIEQFGEDCVLEGIKFPAPLDIFETSVVSILSDVNSYMKTTKPGEMDYQKEREFLHDLSDIRSELVMIQDILEQQKEILNSLLNDRPEAKVANKDDSLIADAIDRLITERLKDKLPTGAEPAPKPTNATSSKTRPPSRQPLTYLIPPWAKVEKSQTTLTKYQRRVMKIDADAERVEKAVQDKLDLKRTYASIKDAHSSLLLSTAVIGFTIITIIFAPLAFLTALFALKIDGFDRLQLKGQDSVYSSGKMVAIFVSSEFLTIMMTVAFVAASLWYIDRLDQIKEGEGAERSTGKVKGKAKIKNRGSKEDDKQPDLESQKRADNI